ncbi:MAG: hypothetical protein KAS07_00680 [Candidatus Pacebacteria bacterium]|nr:hypothetical protein [Candidatus Paceibacterota bacterium]
MTKVDIKKLDNSEIEIIGKIPADLFDKNREQAIKDLGKNVELQGFRKGHVPEKVLEKHLGEHSILEEMAEITIGKEYKNIIIENKLDPISRPNVAITKMAIGNPLEFKIKLTVMPEVILGDYKKAASEAYKEEIKVTVDDKDVENTIEEIRRMHAGNSSQQKEVEEKNEGDNKEPELPEFNDEFVKTLGDFKDIADFKNKLKENIKLEKERKESDKKRIEMMEKIITDANITLPHIIVEAELNKMLAQFRTDVERMGMKFEDYLKNSKKTEEEIRKEFEKEAEKKAKIQLSLNKIAIEEKLTVDHEKVHKQVDVLAKQYPDANKEQLHVYVESTLTNQKTLEFLENQRS